jgi:hypothetical protein
MLSDYHVEHGGILEGSQHHGGVLDPPTVIGETDSSRFRHESHFRKLNTLKSLCESPHRVNVRFSRLPGFSVDVLDVGIVLDRGFGVLHANDGGKTRRNGRCRAACYRFFFFVTGLAEVNMDVDQTGRYQLTGGIDHLAPWTVWYRVLELLPDRLNPAINDEHITLSVDSVRRVKDPTVFYQDSILHRSPLTVR